MIHLLIANKVKSDGSALFYIGNIAPDAVVDWHDKDITHFRNLDNREPALVSLASSYAFHHTEWVKQIANEFCEWRNKILN